VLANTWSLTQGKSLMRMRARQIYMSDVLIDEIISGLPLAVYYLKILIDLCL